MSAPAQSEALDTESGEAGLSIMRRAAIARMCSPWAPSVIAGLVFLALWQFGVTAFAVPAYVLPAPTVIGSSLWTNRVDLIRALGHTAVVTFGAFALAVLSGVVFGAALTLNRTLERIVWPYAVALQVTPIIAIAPLVIIWVGLSRVWLALLILSWLVAFFPMLSSTVIGIKSADRGLQSLFTLYGASRWQRLRLLQLPNSLPFVLTGARISSGLSVIGAVVAEFVAGSGTSTGLAWTIIQAGNMLDIPRMFAALVLLSAFGIAIWLTMTRIQTGLLSRWHESEMTYDE